MTTATIPTMTEETVRDLIALLRKHPDLRRELKNVLFSDLDQEKALPELATTVNQLQRTKERTEVSI